ncbi:MAG: hypoxanthine-guanine phosphoribosyltransferase [Gammaproteobacteria bacterium]|nr:hypoxanthine-guanine phosphoribosyltransferase [Gammaproteobacteria bacterium]MBU1653999.1 hypoxanthine-guanine phosphoribosyltransferase [Gammaproteobacteria bacterium]MBU1960742.1 hypoxanthine-guanine phosphoribosyltransferase [Gammaproteobacteria bacterium]
MAITPEEAQRVYRNAGCLYNLEQVEAAIDTMATAIMAKLGARDPVVLSVMNGGLIPAGRLLTRLDFPLRQGYIHATRYRETMRGHALEWVHRPDFSLQGEIVLIIDDILDEGYTLEALIEACQEMGAAEVYSALLCEKEHDRGVDIQGDFIGLKVPDRYVFGYGMDYKGYLRNAPGIFAVAGE